MPCHELFGEILVLGGAGGSLDMLSGGMVKRDRVPSVQCAVMVVLCLRLRLRKREVNCP